MSVVDAADAGSTAIQRLLGGSTDGADVDEALADAIDAAVVLADLHAVDGADEWAPFLAAVACIELVVAVRHGAIDPPMRRISADRWLEVILRCVPDDERLRPLAQLLVLLASPSFDLARAPATRSSERIDQWIDLTKESAAARRGLLDELTEHEVILPVVDVRVTDDGVDLVFATIMRHGVPHVAAYTTHERFEEFARVAGFDISRSLAAARSELARLLPAGHALILNPGSVTSVSLTEAEVRTGRLGPALVGDGDLVIKPLDDPSIASVVAGVTGVVACRLADVDGSLVVVVGVADDYEDPAEVLAEVGAVLSAAGVLEGVVVDRRTPIGKSVLAAEPAD